MGLADQIKPISYLKANAAAILDQLAESREPMIITQNGEAKAVLQDLASYEESQETLALLKILAMSEREIRQGQVMTVAEARQSIKRNRKRR